MKKDSRTLGNRIKRNIENLKIRLILLLVKIGVDGAVDHFLKGVGRVTGWLRQFYRERALTVLTLIVCMAGLLILRACAYGYEYFPQLDDYIQYWYYPGFASFAKLCAKTGLLGSRPLSGVMDYFVWSPLPWMTCVVILSVLVAVSAVIFREVLRRY